MAYPSRLEVCCVLLLYAVYRGRATVYACVDVGLFGGVWFCVEACLEKGNGGDTSERWQAVVLAASAVAAQYEFFQGLLLEAYILWGYPSTYPSIYSGVPGHQTCVSW